MFCPNCKSEYRSGFSSCTDCGTSLVQTVPPKDIESIRLQSPDLARSSHFLAWFVPMTLTVALFAGAWSGSAFFRQTYIVVCMCLLVFAHNIGAFWMIYQAIRYEKNVQRYVILAFVPFMFVWYVLVRLPLRRESQGNSEFIR
jgi:hypothetical protein